MSTVLAASLAWVSVGPLVVLMAWWDADLRGRYWRVRRPPLVSPVALEIYHHGPLAKAFVDWSAWNDVLVEV